VVENDAAPGDAEQIAREYGASYRLCTYRGLSAARNLGVRSCFSDLLAFIDDDAVCDPDWIRNAVSLFEDERIDIVTGKVIFHSDPACTSAATHEFDPGDHLVDRKTKDWFGMTVFGGVGLGGNFIVRRDCMEQIGGFDERLGRGALMHASEENLFVFRAVDAGCRIGTCSRSLVRHPFHDSNNSDAPIRSIAISTAMVALLALEHSRHFGDLCRYLWGAIRRTPQSWRQRPVHLLEGMAKSRLKVYFALFAGPFLYAFTAITHLIGGTPNFPAKGVRGVEEIAAQSAAPKMRA
jgi:GT2 family glycosyltransferase